MDLLRFGILSKSSYRDLRKMMMVKPLKALKMPLVLGVLKYLSEEELLEEKLLEYIQ